MAKGKKKPPVPAKFKVGDKVRVRRIRDTDYPDMPLGGWAGQIAEVHGDGMYTVRWSEKTLAAIHPVFKNRCEKDGLKLDQYWLDENDLEPDVAGPLDIEHPKEIKNKPLSPKDEDDRIRMVFGLTSNDPLPEVDDDTLASYREYLSEKLSFPFEAEHTPERGHMLRRSTTAKVTGLGDPDDELMIDDMYGIMCEARKGRRMAVLPLGELEVNKGKPNRQLVSDYCCWFWNYR